MTEDKIDMAMRLLLNQKQIDYVKSQTYRGPSRVQMVRKLINEGIAADKAVETEDEERQADEVNIAFQMGAEWQMKRSEARIEQLEAALREIALDDYGLQEMFEDGTDTPRAKAEYYAGQVERRQCIARTALAGEKKDD